MLRNLLRAMGCTLCGAILLAACGGDGDESNRMTLPDNPRILGIAIHETRLEISWLPPDDDGGGPIQSYDVSLTSIAGPGGFGQVRTVTETSAVIEWEPVSGTTYRVAVTARNPVGIGPPDSMEFTTGLARPATYQPLTIEGDTSPSGVFDPSVVRLSDGQVWMAYSGVNYYKDGNGRLVQDVGINLARSDDAGKTFTFVSTIAAPEPARVTDTDPRSSACGASVCDGRWVYETAWLIHDETDPDPARRFKLFAHQYFLNPAGTAPTLYHLGAIVMWTAASPDGTWSAPAPILGWQLTPPELQASTLVNALHGDLAQCIAVSEGGASVRGGTIDIVLTCVVPGGNPLPQKIVLLRSTDHASTFSYVSTLLTPPDAVLFGGGFFSAPSILPTQGGGQILLVSPVRSDGSYAGCNAFRFQDENAGTLILRNNTPVRMMIFPPPENHFAGACAWDHGVTGSGVLMNDLIRGATPADTRFRILATGVRFFSAT